MALIQANHQVYIYSFKRSIAEIRIENANVKFFDIFARTKMNIGGLKVFENLKNLMRVLNQNMSGSSNNVVFTRSEMSLIGITNLLAILILGLKKRTVVFTQYPVMNARLHQILWEHMIRSILRIEYFSQVLVSNDNFDDRHVSVIEYSEKMKKYLNNQELYIPLAVPEIDMPFSKGNVAATKSIVCTAKCDPRKGLEELIDMHVEINELLLERIKLKLIVQVLNSNQSKFLRQIREKLDINTYPDLIEIYVNVSPNEARSIIHESDIFILNSTNEPASFSQLEAIALGTPVIIHRNNGSSSILPNNFGVGKVSNYNELKSTTNKFITNLATQQTEIKRLHVELLSFISAQKISEMWLKKLKYSSE